MRIDFVRVAYLLCIGGIFLTQGCGGGGKANAVYPLSTQTRALQIGDTWVYDDNEVVSVSAAADAPRLSRVRRVILGGEVAGEYYTTDNFSQNASGAVTYFSQTGRGFSPLLPNGPDREEQQLTTPQTVLFGQWASGETLSYQLSYEAAADYPTEREGATLTVLGTDTITTPLGTFETWKVQSQTKYAADSDPVSAVYWYAPQIGNFVRARIKNGSNEYDVTLKSTTVPLGVPQTAP